MAASDDLNTVPAQAAASETVRVARHGAVWVITIDRPAVRNAIDRATSEAIAHAMDELDGDNQLTLGILTGAGAHFCSGMDLKAFLRGERVELPGRGLAGMIETPPRKPMIAAVEGYALAGAVNNCHGE
jgi:enoyl-CoA hydratase